MIHTEFKVPHVTFVQEKPFFLKLKFAAQTDASVQPHLDLVVERQIEPVGQLGDCQLAVRLPARVTITRATRVEIELALRIHDKRA